MAPLTIDSVFSPAAACSGPQLVATVLVGNNGWDRSADDVAPFDGDASFDNSRRYGNVVPFSVAPHSLIVVSGAIFWGRRTVPNPSIAGGGLTFSAPTLLRFDNNGGPDRGFIVMWTARNDTSFTIPLVRLTIDLGLGAADGFVGQVVQVARTGATTAPAGGEHRHLRPAQPEPHHDSPVRGDHRLPHSRLAASGELMFAAGLADDDLANDRLRGNSLQAATWSSTAYGSPIAENFVDGGQAGFPEPFGTAFDITMGAFFRTTTTGSRAAWMTAAASPFNEPPLDLDPAVSVDLGTIALEITCA